MIFVVSNGWLLNRFKNGITHHDEYVLETLEAARFLQVSTIELKRAVIKAELLFGYSPPDAYKVGNKYYFLCRDLMVFKQEVTVLDHYSLYFKSKL
ncbi:hypothetical protein [uncultured Tolumonas sp.]|uniref:hypothetical protein n=1 Tax=uncultured Tolumonas sp. TaxID=263765 RepID=UPI002A0A9B45|nr:hypothetical protein [uncultured Tolumonas sp.]